MLREHVVELVESGLQRSRPGRRLTLTVMAGLAANAAGTKTALAGAGTGAGAWKAAAGAAGASGLLGSLLGTAGGLLGGWLGMWVPAQAASTRRERDAIDRARRRMLLVSMVFIGALFGLIYAFAGKPGYLIVWGGWMAAFWAYLAFDCTWLARDLKRIRSSPDPDDLPNETALRTGWAEIAAHVGDRVYRSETTFLGLPLVDINWSAPMPPKGSEPFRGGKRVARGWIAIGDDASGVLLAIGSTARGLVAVGGRALGVVSFGGLALGLIAVGGIGLGVLGIGGLCAGGYAFGGGAVGWRAAGGLAVAWDVACGGGAFARHGAVGGAAIARDYAVGGEAHARHANDLAARTELLNHPFTRLAFTVLGQRNALERVGGDGASSAPGELAHENGLKVRIRPITGANNVALLVLYKIGGDHDPQGQSGLAHLVEHLYVTAAAGAAPPRTAEGFFQRYRAGCNAQTGDRYTVVATVFPKGDLDKELAEAAARMGDLRITEAELDREKTRLIEEVTNMFGRFPALGAVNNARELIRPTPRGGSKGGLSEDVRAITLDQAQMHWKRYYKPRNAILVLAGGVDEPEARRAVATHFGKLEAGVDAPTPGEPGSPQFGAVRELAVKSLQPNAEPAACVAYAAPEPGSDLYAPFLVLAARFYSASARPGGGGDAGRPSVYFPLLEDPAALGVSMSAKAGENAAGAIGRLESFVAETIAPPFREAERALARQTFALFLGTAEMPDFVLAQNPYGAAMSLARREQMGIDPVKLNGAFDDVSEAWVRRAAAEIFSASRHSGAFVSPVK